MENLRTELSSNEKLAMMTTGIEGTGEHFVMNGESADKIIARDKQMKFNDSVQEKMDKFEEHNKMLNKYAEQISQDMNGLEIMPMYSYLLIKPFETNPFQKVITTKSGIITDLGGAAPTYKSNETGEIEECEQYIKVGTVIETGHKCEFVKPGDIVFYTVASEVIVPFFKQGFVVVDEHRITAVVNEQLTQRKNNLIHGR